MAAARQSPIYPSLAWRTLWRRDTASHPGDRGSHRAPHDNTGSLTATLRRENRLLRRSRRWRRQRQTTAQHERWHERNILDAGTRASAALSLTSPAVLVLKSSPRRNRNALSSRHTESLATHTCTDTRASTRAYTHATSYVYNALHYAARSGVRRSVVSQRRARGDTHGTFKKVNAASRSSLLYIYIHIYRDVHIYIYTRIYIFFFFTRDSSGMIVICMHIQHFTKLAICAYVFCCTRDTKFNNSSNGGDDSDVASHTPWRSHGLLFYLALVQAERHLTALRLLSVSYDVYSAAHRPTSHGSRRDHPRFSLSFPY